MKKGIYLCKVKVLKYIDYTTLYYNGEYWEQYKSYESNIKG